MADPVPIARAFKYDFPGIAAASAVRGRPLAAAPMRQLSSNK